MDALASDGPIRDSDVKEAVRYYRPKIEAAIAAQAVQIGFREGASQVAFDRDEKARSTPAEALDVPSLARLWREEELTDLDVDCPKVDYEATAAAVLARLATPRDDITTYRDSFGKLWANLSEGAGPRAERDYPPNYFEKCKCGDTDAMHRHGLELGLAAGMAAGIREPCGHGSDTPMAACNDPRHDEIESWYRQVLAARSTPAEAHGKIVVLPPASWAEGAADLLERALYMRSMTIEDAEPVEQAIREHLEARSTPAEALDTGHSPSCPARKGEPCDDSLCGANALRMLLEDIIAGKTNLVAASSPPVRIAGDGGPDTDLWTCSCGLTRPVTGSYGCADCGDGRPDSWERVR